MKEPTLVILAAGMGSRFGGLKQITPVDEYNHAIIDYSLFDAYKAGFRNVAFIIKKENKEDFYKFIGKRIEKYFSVQYIYQEITNIPDCFEVPDGRVKPWGTGHAVKCCLGYVDGPFAVINADDFYGRGAFTSLYNFMINNNEDSKHAMVSYQLKNTVSESGYVSRGVCESSNGFLTDVVERTHIEKRNSGIYYTDDQGQTWTELDENSKVSMNCWAFSNSILNELNDRFKPWLKSNLQSNPMKCEYFLPFVVNDLIKEEKASVVLLNCDEVWYGMTYKEDTEIVKNAIKKMRENNIYPKEMLE